MESAETKGENVQRVCEVTRLYVTALAVDVLNIVYRPPVSQIEVIVV